MAQTNPDEKTLNLATIDCWVRKHYALIAFILVAFLLIMVSIKYSELATSYNECARAYNEIAECAKTTKILCGG